MKKVLFALVALIMILGMTLPVQAQGGPHGYEINIDPDIQGGPGSVPGNYTNPITIFGNASSTDPVGNPENDQYYVQVNWGDGTIVDGIPLTFLSLSKDSFFATWTSTHTYASTGTYTIIAKLYHVQPSGKDGVEVALTAPITIFVRALNYIVITPQSASITAGASQTYTAEAFDQYDNSLGNVTGNTTFSISAGAGGNWTASNVYTSEKAGIWTVTGQYSGKTDTATLIVNAAGLDHIVIAPKSASITAGASQTYTAEAFDQYDNSLGNVTGSTSFSIDTGAGGNWTASYVYTSEKAGTWTVTGQYSGKTDTATLIVNTAGLDHIVITPQSASITAGASQAYTAEAFDQYDNSLGNITGSTSFSIDTGAGGNWTASYVYTSEKAGTWTVTGQYSGKTDTATLIVNANPEALDHIVIAPKSASITAGASQAYTAEAFDQYDNSLGDVTGSTSFSISAGAGGNWTANLYTSEKAANWTVTGQYSGKTDTATLIVNTAGLDHLVISPQSASITAGASQAYTAEAFDQYDNSRGDVTGSTSFSIDAGAGGNWTANLYTSEKAGNWTVTGQYSGKTDTASLVVSVGGANHFNFDPISTQIAWVPFAISVTAVDAGDNIVSSYTGIASLTDLSGSITPTETGNFTAGVWTGDVTIFIGSLDDTITATDGAITGTSNTFDVIPFVPPAERPAIAGVVYNADTYQGIGNVTIELSGAGNQTIATLADGSYKFTHLPMGTYLVKEINPEGYISTTPDAVTVNVTGNITYIVNFGDRLIPPEDRPAIGGVVYDADTYQGIGSVTIELSGADNRTTTTLADGTYLFTQLPEGTYLVKETNPEGYVSTTPDEVAVDVTDANVYTVNFGDRFIPPGDRPAIGGVVYDADTYQGIGNVTIELSGAGNMTTTTLADGTYKFTQLPEGNYLVKETNPAGYISTTPDEVAVEVTDANVYTVNFGDRFIPPEDRPAIGGVVYDADTYQGIGNVTIELSGAGNMTTTTDGTGYYEFTNLASGNYTVTETNPEGYISTTPDEVAVEVTDANVYTVNFGDRFIPPEDRPAIGGVVYDADTYQGIGNVTIELSGAGNMATTTDVTGYYEFTNLALGNYTVTETNPEGYISTTPDEVAVEVTDANDTYTVNFGDQKYTPVPTTLTLTPEVAVNILPSQQLHEFMVTVKDQHGFGMPGQVVDLSSDFGTPSASNVTTGSDGSATFTISSAHKGTATIIATLGDLSDTSTKTWYYPSPPPPPPPPTLVSLVVEPETASVAIGGTKQFTATGYYSTGGTIDLTSLASWASSSVSVATVSAGLATGVGVGSANITATFDSLSDSATLNVTRWPPVISIEVTPESASIALGQSQQFTAIATFEGGSTQDVTEEASWASSDTGVATIAVGLATGVGVGTTNITASLEGVTSPPAILRVGPAVITTITISTEGGTIEVCTTKQLTATATYSDGSTRDVTDEVTWNGSDNSIATVNETGLATGIAVGDVTITASLGGVSGSADLTVIATRIVSILVTPSDASILVNGEQQFVATAVYPDNSTSDITAKSTWTSSDNDVATVVAGLATGESAGTTEITASYCGVTSNPTNLQVNQAVPWSMIGWIIGAALAAGLLFFFLMRRRRKGEPEENAAA